MPEQVKRLNAVRDVLSGLDRCRAATWIQAPHRLAAINTGDGYEAVLAEAQEVASGTRAA